MTGWDRLRTQQSQRKSNYNLYTASFAWLDSHLRMEAVDML